MIMVDFCYSEDCAAKQVAPSVDNLDISFAVLEFQIGSCALDAWTTTANVQTTNLRKDFICWVPNRDHRIDRNATNFLPASGCE